MFRRFAALPFLLAGLTTIAQAATLPGPLAALPVPALPGLAALPTPGLPGPAQPGNGASGGDVIPPGLLGTAGVLVVQPIVISDSIVALPGLEATQIPVAVSLNRALTVPYTVLLDPALLAPNHGGADLKLPADIQIGVHGLLSE